jgi:hypothetical protein
MMSLNVLLSSTLLKRPVYYEYQGNSLTAIIAKVTDNCHFVFWQIDYWSAKNVKTISKVTYKLFGRYFILSIRIKAYTDTKLHFQTKFKISVCWIKSLVGAIICQKWKFKVVYIFIYVFYLWEIYENTSYINTLIEALKLYSFHEIKIL